ncbi:MAG: GIY-YIG nuclease family protein [Bacteroidota bacterium]|nr:GIY-YIG nuclease family protein [Bacteroidota bacterium]
MGYFVYILQSEKDGSFYIGSTSNVSLRLERHNLGWSKSTKGKGHWKVVYGWI